MRPAARKTAPSPPRPIALISVACVPASILFASGRMVLLSRKANERESMDRMLFERSLQDVLMLREFCVIPSTVLRADAAP